MSTPVPHQRQRLVALDAFRGLAVAAMILVNNPGTWNDVYAPLRHSEWNGCSFADVIFPAFLFIVGTAISLSLGAAQRQGHRRTALLLKVFRRAAILFALGIFLNGFPGFDWSEIRIPGVLQRIALCYSAAAAVVLTAGPRGQAAAAAALLLAHAGLTRGLPLPESLAGEPQWVANASAFLDRRLLSGHLLHPEWDPEGILGTLSATATTLLGVLAGRWLRSPRDGVERALGLFAAGVLTASIGRFADPWLPINKYLWSASYTLYTGGLAAVCLAGCYWLVDARGLARWSKPLLVFGTNPIAAYFLSTLLGKVLLLVRVHPADGRRMWLRKYLYLHLFAPFFSPPAASLLFALTYVILWLTLLTPLYRRGIFVKV